MGGVPPRGGSSWGSKSQHLSPRPPPPDPGLTFREGCISCPSLSLTRRPLTGLLAAPVSPHPSHPRLHSPHTGVSLAQHSHFLCLELQTPPLPSHGHLPFLARGHFPAQTLNGSLLPAV